MSAISETCKAFCNQRAISINLRAVHLKRKRVLTHLKETNVFNSFILKLIYIYTHLK